MKKANRDAAILLRILFFLYCLAMIYLLFFRSFGNTEGLTYQQQLQQNCNLIPFYTIDNYLYVIIHRSNPALLGHCIINLAGHVLLFIPAGILIPSIFCRQQNFFRFLLTCAGIILAVETIQLLTLLGSFDVDDIILNLTGVILGFLSWKTYRIIRHKENS